MKNLVSKIIEFRENRDWKQFHSPKNLAGSIAIESSELMELFQWVDSSQSYEVASEKKEKLEEEMADIFIYLLTLAHDTNIDLLESANKKIDINNEKYPVDKSKGSSKKYDQL